MSAARDEVDAGCVRTLGRRRSDHEGIRRASVSTGRRRHLATRQPIGSTRARAQEQKGDRHDDGEAALVGAHADGGEGDVHQARTAACAIPTVGRGRALERLRALRCVGLGRLGLRCLDHRRIGSRALGRVGGRDRIRLELTTRLARLGDVRAAHVAEASFVGVRCAAGLAEHARTIAARVSAKRGKPGTEFRQAARVAPGRAFSRPWPASPARWCQPRDRWADARERRAPRSRR